MSSHHYFTAGKLRALGPSLPCPTSPRRPRRGPFQASRPRRYGRRQPNNWLAFTPCVRATRATDASGSSASSTIRRFSSTVRNRHRGSIEWKCPRFSSWTSLCPQRPSCAPTHTSSRRPCFDAYRSPAVARASRHSSDLMELQPIPVEVKVHSQT